MDEYIEKLLLSALDFGLKELEFWEMTIGEVSRHIDSQNRCRRMEAQEKASYDYIQAQLIIKGVSLCLGAKDPFPDIYTAYPGIFDEVKQEQEQALEEKKINLSVLRFKQFAQTYNNKFINKEVPKKTDE